MPPPTAAISSSVSRAGPFAAVKDVMWVSRFESVIIVSSPLVSPEPPWQRGEENDATARAPRRHFTPARSAHKDLGTHARNRRPRAKKPLRPGEIRAASYATARTNFAGWLELSSRPCP